MANDWRVIYTDRDGDGWTEFAQNEDHAHTFARTRSRDHAHANVYNGNRLVATYIAGKPVEAKR